MRHMAKAVLSVDSPCVALSGVQDSKPLFGGCREINIKTETLTGSASETTIPAAGVPR